LEAEGHLVVGEVGGRGRDGAAALVEEGGGERGAHAWLRWFVVVKYEVGNHSRTLFVMIVIVMVHARCKVQMSQVICKDEKLISFVFTEVNKRSA